MEIYDKQKEYKLCTEWKGSRSTKIRESLQLKYDSNKPYTVKVNGRETTYDTVVYVVYAEGLELIITVVRDEGISTWFNVYSEEFFDTAQEAIESAIRLKRIRCATKKI